MILINISSDSVGLFWNGQSRLIIRNDIINNFHKILFDIIKINNFNTCFVISGPGSFTTLRTTSLVINTFITTQTRTPQLYQLDKISFFGVFVKKKLLPSIGIIHIGQKNNMRQINYDYNGYKKNNSLLYNKSTIQKNNITDLQKTSKKDFFCEGLYENQEGNNKLGKELFIKSINNCNFENKIGNLNYNYNGQTNQIPFFDFNRENVELVTPNYMIEAIK